MKNTFFETKSLLSTLLLVCPFALFSQTNPEIEKKIISEFDSVRKGSIKANDYHFDSTNERHFLEFLKRYEDDTDSRVRSRVRIMKAKIALQSRDGSTRQQVVEDFARDIGDRDDAIAQYVTARLLSFKENEFSVKAKKIMVSIFKRPNYDHDFILICGTAQLKELVPRLKKLAAGFDRTKDDWYSTTAWYATLALARMGDAKKTDAIIAAVELELEPVLRVTRLLRQVAYTRQPDCIKLLQKYLESSETLPGLRNESRGTEFNQYALEYLAFYMDDFPIKPTGIGYSKEEIEIARAFLKKGK